MTNIPSSVLREELRKQCRQIGGLSFWCRAHGFKSSGHICRVLAGKELISDRIANVLGYTRPVGWEKIVDERITP